jgi:hypothetical protein
LLVAHFAERDDGLTREMNIGKLEDLVRGVTRLGVLWVIHLTNDFVVRSPELYSIAGSFPPFGYSCICMLQVSGFRRGAREVTDLDRGKASHTLRL